MQTNMQYLKQMSNSVEIIIENTIELAKLLSLDPIFHDYANFYQKSLFEPVRQNYSFKERIKLYEYLKLKKHIYDKIDLPCLSNEFINSIYFYDKTSETVIPTTFLSKKISEFEDKAWYDLLEKEISFPYIMEIRKVAIGEDIYKYILSIIFKTIGEKSIFVINLDAEYLYNNIVDKMHWEDDITFFILSKDKQLIFYDPLMYDFISEYAFQLENINKEEASWIDFIDNKEWLISKLPSQKFNWHFYIITDIKYFYRQLFFIKLFIIVLSILIILFIILVGLLSSKKLYKPINNLLEYLKKNISKSAGYDFVKNNQTSEIVYIKNYFANTLKKQSLLQSKLKESLPAYREKYILSLLKEGHNSIDEIKDKLNFLGIKLYLDNFMVLVLVLDNSYYLRMNIKERHLFQISLARLVEEKIIKLYKGIVLGLEDLKYVIILNCKKEEMNKIFLLCQEFINEFTLSLNCNCTIGIGSYCSSVIDLKNSFNEALEAVKYRIIIGAGEVIYIDDVRISKEQNNIIIYPKYLVDSLNDCIKNNDNENAKRIFLEIVNNISNKNRKNKLGYLKIQHFFISLLNNLIHLIGTIGIKLEDVYKETENIYVALIKKDNIEDITAWFIELIENIISYFSKSVLEKSRQNVERILKILEDEYGENINLNIISYKMNLNPSYVSRIFKDYMGISFIEYFIDLRIKKAKKMLKETNLKVHEISKKVGYSDANYFIKIFKKKTGKTPGEFKRFIGD